MPDNWDEDDEVSPFRFVPGGATTGLQCDRCDLPTAWSGDIYLMYGDEAPRSVKTVTGCICCDAPVKEAPRA